MYWAPTTFCWELSKEPLAAPHCTNPRPFDMPASQLSPILLLKGCAFQYKGKSAQHSRCPYGSWERVFLADLGVKIQIPGIRFLQPRVRCNSGTCPVQTPHDHTQLGCTHGGAARAPMTCRGSEVDSLIWDLWSLISPNQSRRNCVTHFSGIKTLASPSARLSLTVKLR